MRRNFTGQCRHKVVAVRTDAIAGPALRAWAALLLFAALAFPTHVVAARSSCPLTTSVAPFGASDSVRYQVVLTDGGPGDLDGKVNGSCEVAVRLCRGAAPVCDAGTILDGRVRTVGGAGWDERTRVDDSVTTALEALATGATTGDACSVSRFSLAAEEDASVGFRFRIATELDDGRTATRKSRLAVECLRRAIAPASPPASVLAENAPTPSSRSAETESSTVPESNATEATPKRVPAPAPRRAPARRGPALPNPPEYPPVGMELATRTPNAATAPTTRSALAIAGRIAPAAPSRAA